MFYFYFYYIFIPGSCHCLTVYHYLPKVPYNNILPILAYIQASYVEQHTCPYTEQYVEYVYLLFNTCVSSSVHIPVRDFANFTVVYATGTQLFVCLSESRMAT
jgi:hypothetical protein